MLLLLLLLGAAAVVVVEVIRGASDLGSATALMLLAHTAASQPHLHALPPRSLLVSMFVFFCSLISWCVTCSSDVQCGINKYSSKHCWMCR
jgi:hypothetical protein